MTTYDYDNDSNSLSISVDPLVLVCCFSIRLHYYPLPTAKSDEDHAIQDVVQSFQQNFTWFQKNVLTSLALYSDAISTTEVYCLY